MKGIDIILYEKTQTGTDGFNKPVYTEIPVTVEDVLVAPLSAEDITDRTDFSSAKESYTLGIPKGDLHDWRNVRVGFFGKIYKTYGEVTQGIESLVPTRWHKKVKCELYE